MKQTRPPAKPPPGEERPSFLRTQKRLAVPQDDDLSPTMKLQAIAAENGGGKGDHSMKWKKLASLALAGALTLGLLPALSSPALAADGDTTYTLTIPSTLNVANSGWNALEGGISAKGTLESGMKLVVTPTSENSWNLVANKGEETESKVGYNLAKETGTYSAAAEAPTWEFTELTADGTSQTAGIIVEDYSSKPAGTYTDTVTFTASVVSASVPVTAITLNKTATTISAGQTETLSVSSVTPDDATDQTVTWSSDNEAVATVDADGKVTAVALGTANITATANDGSGVTATCAVTVKQLHSLTLTGPYSGATLVMEYYEGDTWNDMVAKYPTYIKVYSGHAAFHTDGFIYDGDGNWANATDPIDPNKTYEVQ